MKNNWICEKLGIQDWICNASVTMLIESMSVDAINFNAACSRYYRVVKLFDKKLHLIV